MTLQQQYIYTGKVTICYVGVDPGKRGAIGFVWPSPYTPRFRDLREDGSMPVLNLDPLVTYKVFVELPDARPGKGLRDFLIGAGRLAGWWDRAVGAHNVVMVPSTIWAPSMGLAAGERGREMRQAAACSLFPTLTDDFLRVKDHNRVSAMLLAEYGRRRGGL